jgi:hypothetical protein
MQGTDGVGYHVDLRWSLCQCEAVFGMIIAIIIITIIIIFIIIIIIIIFIIIVGLGCMYVCTDVCMYVCIDTADFSVGSFRVYFFFGPQVCE